MTTTTTSTHSGTALPRLIVLGTGYLGATHAICMAVLGHEVVDVDVDEPTRWAG